MEKLRLYSKFGVPVYYSEDSSEKRPDEDEMIILFALPRDKDKCCISAFFHGNLIASREISVHRTEREQLRAVRNKEVVLAVAALTERIREKR